VALVFLVSLVAARPGARAQIFLEGFATSHDSIAVNETLTYTIFVTNATVNLMEIRVTNTFLAPVTILSLSNNYFGGFETNTANQAIFVFTLQPNPPAILTVRVRPTAAGTLTNLISIRESLTASIASEEITTPVTNAVPPETDLGVSVAGPPFPVLIHDRFPFTVTVSNPGPNPATNVVLSNSFPPGIRIIAAPTNFTGNLGTLSNGAVRSFSYLLEATNAGSHTIVSSITAIGDSNTNNNTAATNISVQALVTGDLIATNLTPMTFNPQHSLMEQTVRVVNVGEATAGSVRLIVGGLPFDQTNWLYNAIGTNTLGTNGINPFVIHAAPLDPGESVDLRLEYVVRSREAIDVSNYIAVAMAEAGLLTTTNFNIVITTNRMLDSGAFLIEFAATRGRSYTILYSDDASFSQPRIALPPVVAQADRVQWIDDGPPKTISHPMTATNRFYRVRLNP